MGQNGNAESAPNHAPFFSLRGPALRGFAFALCCAVLVTACSAMAEDGDAGGEDATRLVDVPSYAPSPAPSTTAVGRRVAELRTDFTSLQGAVSTETAQLDSLRASTRANAADYFNATAAINAKLQVGTTKGNPILVSQLDQAQARLDTLGQDAGNYNALSAASGKSASQAAYLLQSVRSTYDLKGAVDEDHAALGALEDNLNGEVVKIDRLQNGISGDLARQTTYLATEHRNLQMLALAVDNGEMYGQSLANPSYSPASLSSGGKHGGEVSVHPAHEAQPGTGAAPSGRPLVVIRFDQDSVDYQSAVYQAVNKALERYPQANFTVMAVSAKDGTAAGGAIAGSDARRNADGVVRTLSQMGVAGNHIQTSQATSAAIQAPEVRIYVR